MTDVQIALLLVFGGFGMAGALWLLRKAGLL